MKSLHFVRFSIAADYTPMLCLCFWTLRLKKKITQITFSFRSSQSFRFNTRSLPENAVDSYRSVHPCTANAHSVSLILLPNFFFLPSTPPSTPFIWHGTETFFLNEPETECDRCADHVNAKGMISLMEDNILGRKSD